MPVFQSYQSPYFLDKDRLAKLQKVFPIIDEMYEGFAKKHLFPGYAFGILLDGKLVHSGSNGFIDLDQKIPVSIQSIFRIASMTKSLTAMAILKLRDHGKLRLDDPLHLYIPEMKNQQFTSDTSEITIRDLLTHTSGLPADDPWGDRKLDETDDELLFLLKKGIFFSNAAGITYEYSNLGYTLLGYIIKVITGISYNEFIDINICQQIGMKDAYWEYDKVSSNKLAKGYRWFQEYWKEEPLLHHGTFGAMGGFMTSIESFSRYVALHQMAWPAREEKELGPIKRSSIREMHQPHRFSELIDKFKYEDGCECAQTIAYGYGLKCKYDSQRRTYVGHSGGLPGFGSNWTILPDYGLGVILFVNATYAPAYKINDEVIHRLLHLAQLQPRQNFCSNALKNAQSTLLKYLPDWENAIDNEIFSTNFFLDSSLESLKKEAAAWFEKAGTVSKVNDIIPYNQLSGYFVIEAAKMNLRIDLDLTPENPPRIQKYQLKPDSRL